MTLTLIALDSSYDPYFVFFVDDKKFDEGDDYHTKMSHKFEGIKEFLTFAKIPFEAEELDFNTKGDGAYHDHDYMPRKDEDLKAYLKRIKKFMEPK